LFDASGLAAFLEYREGQRIHHRPILADLGYCGIQTAIPEAILPYKRARGGTLEEAKRDFNRVLSRDRILIENFFGRWKSLFGVVAEEFRGSRGSLRKIVPITIGLTDWHIALHPLRAVEEEKTTESDEEDRAQPVEFVESSSEQTWGHLREEQEVHALDISCKNRRVLPKCRGGMISPRPGCWSFLFDVRPESPACVPTRGARFASGVNARWHDDTLRATR
jgi:hypothetical protein